MTEEQNPRPRLRKPAHEPKPERAPEPPTPTQPVIEEVIVNDGVGTVAVYRVKES